MYNLIIYIIRISYFSISNFKKGNFSQWCRNKKRINFLLNRKIFQWIVNHRNLKKSVFSDQFYLDAVIEIVFMHYKQRNLIYKISRFFPWFNKSFYVSFSVIFILIGLTGKLFRQIKSMSFVYKTNTCFKSNISICLNFPKHAFNLANQKKLSNYYSFGEYLNLNHSDTQIISIGEYTRLSQKNDKVKLDKDVISLQRYNLNFKINILIFLKRFIRSILKLTFRGSNLFILLIYLRKYLKEFNLKNILEDIGIDYDKNVKNVFILPFFDTGLIKYDEKLYKKFITFNYGQNSFVPPSPNLKNILNQKDILSHLPLYPLILKGNSYGFTSLFYNIFKIKEKLNKKFSLKLPTKSNYTPSEKPIMLGYEKIKFPSLILKKLNNHKFIAIFDNPPIIEQVTISYSNYGDRVSGFEFNKNFISDSVETCINNEFSVLIKPKYSLSMSIYDENYNKLLSLFKNRYKDRFIIANPYLRIGSIIKYTCGSINIPYTSTKLIFDYNNLPSIYYVPEKYKSDFTINSAESIKYGKDELSQYVKSIY